MRGDSEWGERSQAAALFRADAKMRWLFSWNSELCAGEMLRSAGFSSGTGAGGRGGLAAERKTKKHGAA